MARTGLLLTSVLVLVCALMACALQANSRDFPETKARKLLEDEVRQLCASASPEVLDRQLHIIRYAEATRNQGHWVLSVNLPQPLSAEVFFNGRVFGTLLPYVTEQCGQQ